MTLSFAPDAIEQWPLERLKPYVRNAKMHGPEQVAKIAASMAEFGWTVPCLVADDGELIAGHGRVLAAEMLGLSEAPVIVLGHQQKPHIVPPRSLHYVERAHEIGVDIGARVFEALAHTRCAVRGTRQSCTAGQV